MIPVTLLIPCYNAGRFLPRLLKAVQALTRPFTNILCYDDGSTDDTVAVARQLGLEILTPNPNRGVAHARNRLAAVAPTEWIHFHDADDHIAPDFLERLAPLCTEDIDVACCDADWIDEHDGSLHIAWRYDTDAMARDAATHLLANPLGLNNSILRRSTWQNIGGCDESLAIWEDADIHFRLALNGARFRHLPKVLTQSLRRSESFSHDYQRNWRCRIQALSGYANNPKTRALTARLGAEAEKAIEQLLGIGDIDGARQGLALCRRLGHRIPTSNHPALRAIRPLLPPLTALRLRQWFRRRSSVKVVDQ